MAKHWKTPESKTCVDCAAIFERIGNTNDRRWSDTKRCPKCRSTRPGEGKHGEEKERRLGHYEVKNKLIDSFLKGKA